jgi:hypothetical protein
LVCDANDKSKAVRCKSFSFFSTKKMSPCKLPGSVVIDPWLGFACNASDYLELGGVKLESWAGKSKRISWHAGSQGPGWYPANGEYKEAFARAPLEIVNF